MSAAEIIRALSSLNSSELRQIRRRLQELLPQDDGVAACDAAASDAAAMLDLVEDQTTHH